jgi:predicted RNase H-like HicB family nuclease
MTQRYIAVLTPEEEGGYSVHFPDCPGCNTEGDTLDEAIAMANEALEGWIETMRETNQEIAPPSRPENIAAKLKHGEIMVPVTAPSPAAKAVPVTITVREDVLRQIDAGARAQGLNRSQFMAQHSATAAASFAVASVPVVGTVRKGGKVKPAAKVAKAGGRHGKSR